MSLDEAPEGGQTGTVERQPPVSPVESPEEALDLRALAEKVYALLKEELRIERERLGRRTGKGW